MIDVPLVVRKSKTPQELVLKNLGIPKEIFNTHKIYYINQIIFFEFVIRNKFILIFFIQFNIFL